MSGNISNAPVAPEPPPTPSSSGTDDAEILFYEIIYHITEVLFGISVVSALFTIITFLIFPRIRTYPIKLIMYLCCTIFIGHTAFSIAPYLSGGDTTFACTVFGALIHYFLLSNFFWCFCIAFNFYRM